ncbi:MAG: type II secretion system major pseudopilin GspG, partial [Lentisphaerae bacterium]|nr:type II secretion system major pseudopilin GspG [Lentisphaerota bacterium]
IITILATVVGVNVAKEPGRARQAAARASIAGLETALDLYRMHNGIYPTMHQGLGALVERPSTPPFPRNYREEGYLKKKSQLIDPWGTPYIYLVPGPDTAPYEIRSYGADAEPDGEEESADISSVEL